MNTFKLYVGELFDAIFKCENKNNNEIFNYHSNYFKTVISLTADVIKKKSLVDWC